MLNNHSRKSRKEIRRCLKRWTHRSLRTKKIQSCHPASTYQWCLRLLFQLNKCHRFMSWKSRDTRRTGICSLSRQYRWYKATRLKTKPSEQETKTCSARSSHRLNNKNKVGTWKWWFKVLKILQGLKKQKHKGTT